MLPQKVHEKNTKRTQKGYREVQNTGKEVEVKIGQILTENREQIGQTDVAKYHREAY